MARTSAVAWRIMTTPTGTGVVTGMPSSLRTEPRSNHVPRVPNVDGDGIRDGAEVVAKLPIAP